MKCLWDERTRRVRDARGRFVDRAATTAYLSSAEHNEHVYEAIEAAVATHNRIVTETMAACAADYRFAFGRART